MKSVLIGLSLLVSLAVQAGAKPVFLQFNADNIGVQSVSLPKKISIDQIEIINKLFTTKLRFIGKVDGRKIELLVPLQKLKEDNNYYQVRAIILSEFGIEEVCGESWHRELALNFHVSRNGDWVSNYYFEGHYSHTPDNCHTPEEVELFTYSQED